VTRVLTVFGTRPEAIKMAPVLRALARHPARVELRVCVTAQHRQMLDQVLQLFEISPALDLDLMAPDQSLADLTSRVLTRMSEVLAAERPDCVLIQGDTTTVMATAMAAFYEGIPVGHVEAGLRTYSPRSPFPEEINRRIVSAVADLHFAPTQRAVDALLAERVPAERIFLTGNTVVDALMWTAARDASPPTRALFAELGLALNGNGAATPGPRMILVTGHRRESFGSRFESLCGGLRDIADRNQDVHLVYPVHLNPNVQAPVNRILDGHPRIHLLAPQPYETFVHLMKAAELIITDSGGVQEEAPVLAKPVLVVREDTERPEAVEAGVVKIIGTSSQRIVEEAERLLHDRQAYQRMALGISPYGDGHAAERIAAAVLARYA
jgi:UDP-N-acetylglucosamine 2-epimerase (non-hydrolysing)